MARVDRFLERDPTEHVSDISAIISNVNGLRHTLLFI